MGNDNSNVQNRTDVRIVTDGKADPPRGWLDQIADALDLGRNEDKFGRPSNSPRGVADRVADIVDGGKGPRRRA
jgi:hypothetical protein